MKPPTAFADKENGIVSPERSVPVCRRLIQSEFREMPGLALTEPQVRRLWSLPPGMAESLLADLVASGFLRCNDTGRYVRADIQPS